MTEVERVEAEPAPRFVVDVYGASDDLIEIDGVIDTEFEAKRGGDYVGFSDGSMLWVRYDSDSVWRIKLIHIGEGTEWVFNPCPVDDDRYSETFTLSAAQPFKWALVGEQTARA
jgi:hypothetical protein